MAPSNGTMSNPPKWFVARPSCWKQERLKLPLLRKYQIHMVSRRDSAGQFLQTIVLQVEVTEASEIPKKTFWKRSQFVALQVNCVQVFQAIEHSSGKLSQIHVCQIQGAVPVTSTAYRRRSDAINTQVYYSISISANSSEHAHRE